MKRLISLCLLTLLLPLNATAADKNERGASVSLNLGKAFFDDNRALNSDYEWGITGGYRWDENWAVEAGYYNLETSVKALQTAVDVDRYYVDALYHFPGGEKFDPFVAVGLGKGDGNSAAETLTNVGVGFKYHFNPRFAFRSDVKWFQGDNGADDFSVSVGLHMKLQSNAPRSVYKMPITVKDSDNDGVADDRDQCPTTPAGEAVNRAGCPLDSDMDGVLDSADSCPTTPPGAAVDSRGCALDSDRDGVKDYADNCANTPPPGKIDDMGCYIVITENVLITLKVQFDSDSATSRTEHRGEVEKVHRFMTDNPMTRVTIEGHTDDRGSEAYNQSLSERRARTIASMLINDFGIAASKVSIVGYGESQPIESNDTLAGRQANRRVVANIQGTSESM